jgi:hypothetical protein
MSAISYVPAHGPPIRTACVNALSSFASSSLAILSLEFALLVVCSRIIHADEQTATVGTRPRSPTATAPKRGNKLGSKLGVKTAKTGHFRPRFLPSRREESPFPTRVCERLFQVCHLATAPNVLLLVSLRTWMQRSSGAGKGAKRGKLCRFCHRCQIVSASRLANVDPPQSAAANLPHVAQPMGPPPQ